MNVPQCRPFGALYYRTPSPTASAVGYALSPLTGLYPNFIRYCVETRLFLRYLTYDLGWVRVLKRHSRTPANPELSVSRHLLQWYSLALNSRQEEKGEGPATRP